MDAGTQTERRNEPKEKSKAVTVHVLDGTMALTEANAHLLAQIAPFFGSARSCGSVPSPDVSLDVPSEFLMLALALARAFMEWDEQEGEVKHRQRARVAKMLARIRGCPFNAHYADALGMEYTLPQMETRVLACRERAQATEPTEQETRRYFGNLPAGPACFSLEVCFLIVALKRTYGIVVSFEHHEIDGTAYIGETRVVRGKHSPHGCAVQSATLAVGLRAQATIRLSYFEGGGDKWQLVETPATQLLESIRASHDALAAPGKSYDEARLAGILLELATMIGTLA
jgi:hypothetical protein